MKESEARLIFTACFISILAIVSFGYYDHLPGGTGGMIMSYVFGLSTMIAARAIWIAYEKRRKKRKDC